MSAQPEEEDERTPASTPALVQVRRAPGATPPGHTRARTALLDVAGDARKGVVLRGVPIQQHISRDEAACGDDCIKGQLDGRPLCAQL